MSNFAPTATVARKKNNAEPLLMGWRAKEHSAKEEEAKVRLREKMQRENEERDTHYKDQGKLYAGNAFEMIDILQDTLEGTRKK